MEREPERMRIFLDSLYSGNSPLLEEMEARAAADGVPVIRKGTQGALKMLLTLRKPERILEIGTAVGFSSVFFCENSDASVTTIENNENRIREARRNFRRAGVEARVTLLPGDAVRIVPELSGMWDFIFLDAAKGQYPGLWSRLRCLLPPGGVLAADNVLQEGTILGTRFQVDRRERTIHARLREFLREISSDPEFVTDVLPVGDGLSVSVRRA